MTDKQIDRVVWAMWADVSVEAEQEYVAGTVKSLLPDEDTARTILKRHITELLADPDD